MLATITPTSAHMPDLSNIEPQSISALPDPSLLTENRFCPGCKNSVLSDVGGVVIAFGQSFFHVDCFKCAKCGNQVTADTNLLLLSDGSPVCENCSYSCSVCNLPILDEAIMALEDSYHAHCFKCKVCKNRIDDLMFAKTSHGIYCMDCHNQRVAKSRQRAERQKQRDRERDAAMPRVGDNASTSSRPGTAGNRPSAGTSPSVTTGQSTDVKPANQRNSRHSEDAIRPSGSMSATRQGVASSTDQRAVGDGGPLAASSIPIIAETPSSPPHRLTAQRSVTLPDAWDEPPLVPLKPASISSTGSRKSSFSDHTRPVSPASRTGSLDVPSSSHEKSLVNRKSFDVSSPSPQLRPTPSAYSLNSAVANGNSTQNMLGLPDEKQSRRDKRGSINPALARAFTGGTSSAPTSSTYGRDSPRLGSSLRDCVTSDTSQSSSPDPSLSLSAITAAFPSPPSPTLPDHGSRARSGSNSSFRRGDVPSRPSSRNERERTFSQESTRTFGVVSSFSEGRRKDERRPPNLPLGVATMSSRMQKSFSERPQPSPTLSVHTVRRNRSSSGTLELDLPRPSTSPTPTSPSHRVDVPHGIESGTDTEAETEEGAKFDESSSDDHPPALPPKEPMRKINGARPPPLRLNTISSTHGSSEGDSTDLILDSPESSPIERTSHATFIAPALPPIRISMGTSDFSDLLKSVGGNVMKLDQLKEAAEEGTTGKVNGKESIAGSPSSTMAITTPNGTSSTATPIDDTPVRRPPLTVLGGNYNARTASLPERSESPSVLSLKDSVFSRFSDESLGRSQSPTTFEGTLVSLDDRPSSSLSLRIDGRPSLDEKYRTRKLSTHSATPTLDSFDDANITVTSPESLTGKPIRAETLEYVKQQLREAVASAVRDDGRVTLQVSLVQTMIVLLEQRTEEYSALRRKLDGAKRASQQYMDGLTVAQAEYDRELKARRDAEAEVSRLRVLLSGQAVRLSAISGEWKKQETQKQLTREMSDNLSTLERSLSQLKVERDMTLAEVEQLSASKSSSGIDSEEGSASSMTRALSMRFDNIKSQYKNELVPLTEQREAMMRELAELKASRDAFLEETTMLNARNEELAQLNAQYVRRLEQAGVESTRPETMHERSDSRPFNAADLSASVSAKTDESFESIVHVTKVNITDSPQIRPQPSSIFPKWPGSKPRSHPQKDSVSLPDENGAKSNKKHFFQQISVLRVARCDHCGDKMWGSQLRCSGCNTAVHTRCLQLVRSACAQTLNSQKARDERPPLPALHPSIFGRDLIEQVRCDALDGQRFVPVIVEKCIDAVDYLALDFEGIYRKTGGSAQSKAITQLFDHGDYRSFDLRDTNRFNDICSVTSVLKSYFRALPDPLLTHALHDRFVEAAAIKDPALKGEALTILVHELPPEHYHTTRVLMQHLHRISERADKNLMNARNLGVVFGPTLMRSRDPNAEFSDMAGKALSVEWLVQNALVVFS